MAAQSMTNTPSPDEDRELIEALRKPDAWQAYFHGGGSFSAIEEAAPFKAADRLESLLSDREQGVGGYSGSREPSPRCTGLGPSGFDPGRKCQHCGGRGEYPARTEDDAYPMNRCLACHGTGFACNACDPPQDEAETPDVVERVARAIASAEWSRDARMRRLPRVSGDSAERYAERSWGLWTDHAEAAITAGTRSAETRSRLRP